VLQTFDENLFNNAFINETSFGLSDELSESSSVGPESVETIDTMSMSPYSPNMGYLLDGTAVMSLDHHYDQDNILMDLMSILDVNTLQDQQQLPVCPVCGNEAGKHSHYGGRGCSSCRAFFRRSVQNRSYEKFSCTKGSKNCKIDSKSWKSCRYCRYHRCLASGMKPSWVLNETERKVRHEKRTGKYQQPLVEVANIPRSPNNELTQDEMRMFTTSHSQWKFYVAKEFSQFYASHTNTFRSIITAVFYRTIVPYEDLKLIEDAGLSIATKYFIKSPDMMDITENDRQVLAANNVALMLNVGQAVALGNTHTPATIAEMWNIIMSGINDNQFGALKQVMDDLNVSVDMGTHSAKHLKYHQVYSSPWAANIGLEIRHQELSKKICEWPVDETGDRTVKVDKLMMYFLCHILLYNTDFIRLEEPAKVAAIQGKYLRMLHRYLKFKYNQEANNRLGDGIMIASLARESNEIRQNRLPL
jgi:hypothetical protein